ncbi:N-6 DNA methylase [bacterium]|nr:N-6 DNA methylase [bacterium]
MANDSEHRVHQEWLGFLQPVGLVVSPPALEAAQAFPNKNIIADHSRFLDLVDEVTVPGHVDPVAAIRNLPQFCSEILRWPLEDLVGTDEGGELPGSLEAHLDTYNETLRPTYAVREPEPDASRDRPWMMLIQEVATGLDLDDAPETSDHRWHASPQARFERLLRETQVPIGLLSNRTSLRLVYAPRGETSGHLTFPVQAMTEVAGRPIFAALMMLLSAKRLFLLSDKQRLPAILADSRKYQNLVSTQLAEQVLAALYELVRGFQAADDQRKGDLLRDVLANDPNHVYAGLLTVLMRLVFVLYAEDRDLLSNDEVYQKYYAVSGLFERLREDAGRHTDTMDHRYGAWAQLLTLFRLIHDGGRHGGMKLQARKGYLFDPDRYPFLEGRAKGSKREPGVKTDPPHVSDGVVFRVLQNLLILGGERLSYRTLDVEQIGSVYETMMGFNLEMARGRSIAIKPKKAHGAPTSIDLDELLTLKPAERVKWLKEKAEQDVTGQAATALKEAQTPEDAVAALEKKIAKAATPRIVPPGAMVLQPSDERRKSGSHYTPRSLTEPIVRTTLRPILERLGPNATPEQILDLKVCDPAMGSGAFLVEACRQLGEALVKAWHAHARVPGIPPDEDEILHARRIVAQRCLYGVDKNPMAVDLAKLSLWLATLAKDHPFTFLDHALRHGDSLVGLTKAQILGFHWKPNAQQDFSRAAIEGQLNQAMEKRKKIREAPEGATESTLRENLKAADGFLAQAKRYGDLAISAFFSGDNDRQRKERLESLAVDLKAQRTDYTVERHNRLERALGDLRGGTNSIVPFHWEIEFPEVFDRKEPGFDAFVGNPPFFWGNRISTAYGTGYRDWLLATNTNAIGNADLVVYFLRRAFNSLRKLGTLGLIATNTIAETDTRFGGLDYVSDNGGSIFSARRDMEWPGEAGVRVSVVHILKGQNMGNCELDGSTVLCISTDLREIDGRRAASYQPQHLAINFGWAYKGVDFGGDGFLLSAHELELVRNQHPGELRFVHPVLNAQDFASIPDGNISRHIINFTGVDLNLARSSPFCMTIVEQRVKPMRDGKTGSEKKLWWQFRRSGEAYMSAVSGFARVLIGPVVSKYLSLSFFPPGIVFTNAVNIFAFEKFSPFCILQSRVHEYWAFRFASTLRTDLRYSPSDCFETFPFPTGVLEHVTTDSTAGENRQLTALEVAGQSYYEFRAKLMVRNNEGLTKTYNRFHDPEESSPDIMMLRELHAAMDRAVLEAYGWHDLAATATCEFLLDYEEDEDDDESSGGRRRKKPWRYRWPDDFRDEVLARLLELNKQRAEEERLSGAAAEKTSKKAKSPRGKKKPADDQPDMFSQSSQETGRNEEGQS